MPAFLVRLVPPRSSFPADMTPEEAELMGSHTAHCRALIEEGAGIAFGPVMDPAGVWGLGLIEADDEPALRRMLERDPVIASGRGFRYETFEMPSIMLRPGPGSGRPTT